MISPDLNPFDHEKTLRLGKLKEMAQQVQNRGRFDAPGALVTEGSFGRDVFFPPPAASTAGPPTVFAQVTGNSGSAYAWVQQTPQADGAWIDTPNGLAGSLSPLVNAAYEKNGGQNVAAGTIVVLEKGYLNPGDPGQEWLFDADATVQLSDRSLFFAGITNFSLSPPDVWIISSPTKGQVQIAINPDALGGNLEVQNQSGSETVLNVNDLIFSPDSDWQITQLSTGQAEVSRAKQTITIVTNVTCANGLLTVTKATFTCSV